MKLRELITKLEELKIPDTTPVYLDCAEFPKTADKVHVIDGETLSYPTRSYFTYKLFVKLS